MWLQLLIACVLAGLSGAYVALTLIRGRKSGQDLAQKLQAHAELGRHLALCDEKLRQHAATASALQDAMAAKKAENEAVGERCNELQRHLQQLTEQEQERLRSEQELSRKLSARASELECHLASRNEELRKSADAIDLLRSELAAMTRQSEASSARCAELESADSARAAELAGRDEELRRRAAAIELLEAEGLAKDRQVEALGVRCAELEQAGSARAAALEVELASRDEELHRQAAAIELLEADVLAKARQVEALGLRCAELEQQLGQQSGQEQERLWREQELQCALSARAGDLESQLASRDEELRQQAATIEHQRAEALAKDRQIEELGERCAGLADLKRQLQQREAQEQERLLCEQELENARSARAAELESQLASRGEELRRQAATIELQQAEALSKDRKIEELGQRCARLADVEGQLQRRAEQEQERLLCEQELAGANAARAAELDSQLASRDQDLQQLRGEHARLTGECQAAAELAEARARELRGREQSLAELGKHMEALEFAVQSCHDDIRSSEALIDGLVQNRVSALFERRGAGGSDVLPDLYLRGLAQGDFELALQGLLGVATPLPATSVARLGERWRDEHALWKQLPLEREVAYLWADGSYVEAGSDSEDAAILLVVASFVDGSRAVIAAEPGDPRSEEAWSAILRDLAQRGMSTPRFVVAAEPSGLWAAIDELGWDSARQHCWSHKSAEVLAALPDARRAQASEMLQAIAGAESRAAAKQLRDRFVKRCGVRCAGAGELLLADWTQLTRFYALPRDHWPHLRTTDVIDSPLTAIRLRAAGPKPCKPAANVASVVWKLLTVASGTFPTLDAPELAPAFALP